MAETKSLTAKAIFEADDIRIEPVEVPEWGGVVYIRTLTAADRDRMEAAIANLDKQGKSRGARFDIIRSAIAAASLCDETGKAMFDSKDFQETIKKLGAKSAKAIGRISVAASKLSGIEEEDVEELAENLKNDQPADSPSD